MQSGAENPPPFWQDFWSTYMSFSREKNLVSFPETGLQFLLKSLSNGTPELLLVLGLLNERRTWDSACSVYEGKTGMTSHTTVDSKEPHSVSMNRVKPTLARSSQSQRSTLDPLSTTLVLVYISACTNIPMPSGSCISTSLELNRPSTSLENLSTTFLTVKNKNVHIFNSEKQEWNFVCMSPSLQWASSYWCFGYDVLPHLSHKACSSLFSVQLLPPYNVCVQHEPITWAQ